MILCRMLVMIVQIKYCETGEVCLKCRISKGAGETKVSVSAFAIWLAVMSSWWMDIIVLQT